MTWLNLLDGRPAPTLLAAAVVIAAACAAPDVTFVPDAVDHCENHELDDAAGESDLDCGGEDCPRCELGQHCAASLDCAVGQCIDGSCQQPGCENEARDGDETGIDCGGSCDPCGDHEPCVSAMDCRSKVCGEDLLCASATCMDGARNGDELGVDCGGAFCNEGCGIGTACVVATDCQSGLCDAATLLCALNCSRGTDECDGELDEPCETNLLTSEESCGACGHACDLPHAHTSCAGGTCQIDECVKPWLRCNADSADGCEINGSTDVMNCDGCGTACPDFHGTPKCVDSACVIECGDDFGDCDRDPLTGCEASLDDVANCGACGNACPDTDGVPNCVGGKCGVADCAEGLGDCDGDEVCESLQGDPMNCGRCGNACGASNGKADCVDGQCVVESCDDGWDDCDADSADHGYSTGCETNVRSDGKHCGGCENLCDVVPHGTGSCAEGTCTLDCTSPFDDCDGEVANGCETDLTTDTDCGACKKACPEATPSCIAGDGAYQCQAKIGIANASPYPTASAAAGSLTFNVTPRAGTNRLALVAIVSDALTSNAVSAGIAGARPGSVKWGTQSMTAGPSQVGVNDGWSPDLFVYYLPLGDAASDGDPVAISIGGSTGPSNVVVAQSLQLNGVRQSMPITASAGGFLGAPDPSDPGVTAPSLPVEVSGSLIYSFLSDYWDTRTCTVGTSSSGCPAWSVTPAASLTLIETMATAPLSFYPPNSGNAPMRAFGMVVTAAAPGLPAAGTYTPSWSDPNPGRLTHLSVAIAPAVAP